MGEGGGEGWEAVFSGVFFGEEVAGDLEGDEVVGFVGFYDGGGVEDWEADHAVEGGEEDVEVVSVKSASELVE